MMKKPVHLTISVLVLATAVLGLALLSAPPMGAANKDMVQLQTQVQQLQDAVARLQESNDKSTALMQHLVEQTADSVNKMSATVSDLQKHVQTGQDAQGGKVDQISGQIQSMNDSIDEIKARMGRLDTALQAIQSQQQSINANIQNLAQPSTAMPAPGTGILPNTTPTASPGGFGPPSARTPAAPTPSAPPVTALYNSAINDFSAAKYVVAADEFNQVIAAYPNNTLSGNAYFYLGEIDFHAGKFASAAKNYDSVLEQFPGNNKIPPAHLHKAEALIAMKQTTAGVREYQALIQRFPNSPEAQIARGKLSALGIKSR